jgi:hypothetical protein
VAGEVCSSPVPLALSPRPPSRPDPDRDGSAGVWSFFLPLHPGFANFSPVKALLQTRSSGRAPVPPEKRFLISFSAICSILLSVHWGRYRLQDSVPWVK